MVPPGLLKRVYDYGTVATSRNQTCRKAEVKSSTSIKILRKTDVLPAQKVGQLIKLNKLAHLHSKTGLVVVVIEEVVDSHCASGKNRSTV